MPSLRIKSGISYRVMTTLKTSSRLAPRVATTIIMMKMAWLMVMRTPSLACSLPQIMIDLSRCAIHGLLRSTTQHGATVLLNGTASAPKTRPMQGTLRPTMAYSLCLCPCSTPHLPRLISLTTPRAGHLTTSSCLTIRPSLTERLPSAVQDARGTQLQSSLIPSRQCT